MTIPDRNVTRGKAVVRWSLSEGREGGAVAHQTLRYSSGGKS
jgi:hypothetical protein